ncbi:hypothetical protein [Agromyces humi]|uniref:hypothetical protein n=1 Tax=Agromyces humi TaxID=1766800 RepID=UPI00135A2DD2|nr:hypothetical protein [Agromyces humi]
MNDLELVTAYRPGSTHVNSVHARGLRAVHDAVVERIVKIAEDADREAGTYWIADLIRAEASR